MINDKDKDQQLRGKAGLCLSLVKIDEESLRLYVDAVELQDGGDGRSWTHGRFITHAPITTKDLTECSLSDDKLARFGAMILGCLKAQVPKS